MKTKIDYKARKKDIIRMRKNRYQLKDIAKKHGISKQRVFQILQANLTKS